MNKYSDGCTSARAMPNAMSTWNTATKLSHMEMGCSLARGLRGRGPEHPMPPPRTNSTQADLQLLLQQRHQRVQALKLCSLLRTLNQKEVRGACGKEGRGHYTAYSSGQTEPMQDCGTLVFWEIDEM
jgi:hypothetical protein|mmetsp:Transcript_63165/g.104349  ORF Transcript_63165/g.104349 Transcript_63165/m.104349 type:complete len:127 (-) Transcript_63165:2289-2669(-)